jgi:hypothetical protein
LGLGQAARRGVVMFIYSLWAALVALAAAATLRS